MKRTIILAVIAVVLASSTVQGHSAVSYRVPQIRFSHMRLPSSRDRNVQMAQTIGVIGLETYKTAVVARHGDRAIDMARRDRELQHQEILAQQNARQEAELQQMAAKAAEIKEKQEAKQMRAENERIRLENQRLQLEIKNKELRQKLESTN